MRTNEQRLSLIQSRRAQIRRNHERKKQFAQSIGGLCVCLVLIVAMGIQIPGSVTVELRDTEALAGAASILESNGAIGYVVMGLLSFLLGVTVTVLLYRIHRDAGDDNREARDHEL